MKKVELHITQIYSYDLDLHVFYKIYEHLEQILYRNYSLFYEYTFSEYY